MDMQIKLLTIGDSAVGKTCLLLRYASDSFQTTFITTIGIDFKTKVRDSYMRPSSVLPHARSPLALARLLFSPSSTFEGIRLQSISPQGSILILTAWSHSTSRLCLTGCYHRWQASSSPDMGHSGTGALSHHHNVLLQRRSWHHACVRRV